MDFLDYIEFCQEEKEEEKQVSAAETKEEKRSCRGVLYKVKKGDTLYSISRNYNLRVRDLMRANPFVDVYRLQIGEELCIPVIPGPPANPGEKTYVVKKEDTLLSILKKNRITFEELAQKNRSVSLLKLPAGTLLFLP